MCAIILFSYACFLMRYTVVYQLESLFLLVYEHARAYEHDTSVLQAIYLYCGYMHAREGFSFDQIIFHPVARRYL